MDHDIQEDQIDEEELKEEEKECTCTYSRRRSDKSHLNDQIVESPLKKKKKSSTKIVVLQVSIGTTTQATDARN